MQNRNILNIKLTVKKVNIPYLTDYVLFMTRNMRDAISHSFIYLSLTYSNAYDIYYLYFNTDLSFLMVRDIQLKEYIAIIILLCVHNNVPTAYVSKRFLPVITILTNLSFSYL